LYICLAALAMLLAGLAFSRIQRQKRTLAENRLKIAEQEAQIANQERLETMQNLEIERAYAHITGQEEMQKKIGQELHDGMGAVLSTIKMSLPSEAVEGKTRERVDKVGLMIDDAIDQLRKLSHQLGSVVLERFGLRPQLESLANDLRQTGKIEVELVTHDLNDRLDSNIELNVFRMVQELVSNALKHAQAKNISIQVSKLSQNIRIIVEDDGKGFDPETIEERKGAGIHNIRSRVHNLSGEIQYDSQLDRGTIVNIDIPIVPYSGRI
jgi:two-component system, NarL family, sensor kinase